MDPLLLYLDSGGTPGAYALHRIDQEHPCVVDGPQHHQSSVVHWGVVTVEAGVGVEVPTKHHVSEIPILAEAGRELLVGLGVSLGVLGVREVANPHEEGQAIVTVSLDAVPHGVGASLDDVGVN